MAISSVWRVEHEFDVLQEAVKLFEQIAAPAVPML